MFPIVDVFVENRTPKKIDSVSIMPTEANSISTNGSIASNGKVSGPLSKWIDGAISQETLAVHGGTVPDPITG